MAKSTGNIARVADLLADGVDPRAIRYGLIAVHYRAALSWSDDSLAAAAAALDRLDALVGALEAYEEAVADDPGLPELLAATQARFAAAIADDLNVSASLAALFDFVRDVNRRIDARAISTADAARALALLRDVDAVLGVLPAADDELEPDLRALLDARVEARADRDWAASDRLRDELAVRGISVEDTRDGQRWRRSIDVGRG
jgi:cysteinyl-tRNA synthetase